MLGYWLNQIRFTLKLELASPLLIQDARYNKKDFIKRGIIPGERRDLFPDAIFVSREGMNKFESAILNKRYSQLLPYIPSTTIAGTLRCQAERILNASATDIPIACNVLERDRQLKSCSCDERIGFGQSRREAALDSYRRSCPICRLFGNRLFKSPLTIADGLLLKSNSHNRMIFQRRSGGLDRITGGLANRSLSVFEVLENAQFETTLTVRNFERWQLGLLLFLLRDLQIGILALGSKKSLGFGRVRCQLSAVAVSYFGSFQDSAKNLVGIAELLPLKRYDFLVGDDETTQLPLLEHSKTVGLEHRFSIGDRAAFSQWAAHRWNAALPHLIEQRRKELGTE